MSIMPKLILFVAIFIILQGSAKAQSWGRNDTAEDGSSEVDESPAVGDQESGNLKPQKELEVDNRIPSGPRPEYENRVDLSEYFVEEVNDEKYLASLKIPELFWPPDSGAGRGIRKSHFLIGVIKPDYGLSGKPYIRGKLDFSLGGSFFGIENKGLITISYYLRAENNLGELSSNVSFERLSFSISIPLGKGE